MLKIKFRGAETIKEFSAICRAFVSPVQVMDDFDTFDGKNEMNLMSIPDGNELYVRMISNNIKELELFRNAVQEYIY